MKHIYKIRMLSALMALGICSASFGQDSFPADFLSGLKTSAASLDYSYTADMSGTTVNGNGTLLVQGQMYYMEGDGLKVWCDGSSRKILDESSKEVVIEPAGGDAGDWISNPAGFMESIGEAFTAGEVSSTEFDGKKALKLTLEPKPGSGIAAASLFFGTDGKSLTGISLKIKEGTSVIVRVPSFGFMPLQDSSVFTLDEASLGPVYVVTDLR